MQVLGFRAGIGTGLPHRRQPVSPRWGQLPPPQRLNQTWQGRAVYVPWNHAAVAPLDTPLYTTGMAECRALALVNECKQLLAHLYPVTGVADLTALLDEARDKHGFVPASTRVMVMKGAFASPQLEDNLAFALTHWAKPTGLQLVQWLEDALNPPDPVGLALVRGQPLLPWQVRKLTPPESVNPWRILP